jgi:1-deoxy-D-xylulose-5-phosphate synthase
VAVVGDGALTGGLAWEALNNLGASSRPVVVVLNDNGRSYAPTVGAMGRHLRSIRNRAGYTAVVERLGGTGAGGDPYLPSLFTELGFEYLGPVDGHDVPLLEAALVEAERRRRPVVVHCLTVKGRGYEPAERDEVDRMHAVGAQPGPAVPGAARARTWTGVFGEAMERIGAESENVVALSAAMVEPTGLRRFAERFPGRCFDVGIAEQHAVVSAAGLAMGGAHPVVALYATFAGRAFDQVLLDVGMHRLPVTFALDRAGITGPDGPSHHGIWDLAMLGGVPGMRVAAPRDGVSLVEELAEAVADDRGPTALRYPRSDLGADIEASRRIEGLDVLRGPGDGDVLIVAIGAMARAALDAADALAEDGVDVTVVDPRWVLPIGGSLVRFAAGYRHVVSVEDGVRTGGVGSRLGEALRGTGAEVTALGVPSRFVPQGGRGELLSSFGLDGPGIAAAVRALPGERSTRSAAYGLAAR